MDIVVIGGGAAGLAAAIAARKKGVRDIVILERDRMPGGILRQCIHDGFGLVRYGEALTGPEYAKRFQEEADALGIPVYTETMVTGLSNEKVVTYVRPDGLHHLQAAAVILAMGCRERTRGMLSIPGTRPAGIFTAGTIQNMVNLRNLRPGNRVVILGSGDIGLIMARRLTLEGVQVLAIVEKCAEPGGLKRNVRQCVQDFDIPLFTRHTVSDIRGSARVEGVTIVSLDTGETKDIDCDTLVLSVGLIPENELSCQAGVMLDKQSGGVLTDEYLQASVPGIFACGNAHHVLDLVDYVSAEAEVAGANAAAYIQNGQMQPAGDVAKSDLPKGFPDDSITCVLCPKSCTIEMRADAQGERHPIGQGCGRGADFAVSEYLHPTRLYTGTVRTALGQQVSLRSATPIPRERLQALSNHVNSIHPTKHFMQGDIMQVNLPGLDIDLLVTGA